MPNYKNTLESFKSWCKANKSFMDSDIKHKEYFQAHDKNDNLYFIELNKIQIRELSNIPFVGEAIYKYDSDKNDFIVVSKYLQEEKFNKVLEIMQSTIKDFKERNNIKNEV